MGILPVELDAIVVLVVFNFGVLVPTSFSTALVPGILLVSVVRADGADEMRRIGNAHVERRHQSVAIRNPTPLLHHIQPRRRRLDNRRNLRIRQLDRWGFLSAGGLRTTISASWSMTPKTSRALAAKIARSATTAPTHPPPCLVTHYLHSAWPTEMRNEGEVAVLVGTPAPGADTM